MKSIPFAPGLYSLDFHKKLVDRFSADRPNRLFSKASGLQIGKVSKFRQDFFFFHFSHFRHLFAALPRGALRGFNDR
jgi:hypothetical protein